VAKIFVTHLYPRKLPVKAQKVMLACILEWTP
jgi:hypothetical protein